MSLLTLILPWVLGSFAATPLIGLMLSRTLGGDEHLDAAVYPMDRVSAFGEPERESSKLAAQIVPIDRFRRRGTGAPNTGKRTVVRIRP